MHAVARHEYFHTYAFFHWFHALTMKSTYISSVIDSKIANKVYFLFLDHYCMYIIKAQAKRGYMCHYYGNLNVFI